MNLKGDQILRCEANAELRKGKISQPAHRQETWMPYHGGDMKPRGPDFSPLGMPLQRFNFANILTSK
jgi:hypothetical protein